jgi:hypothetical protein
MKIRITESQYNRLFLKEEKEINFNYDVDTVLGFAKLIDLPLKGQNEFLAKKALKNKEVLSKIYSIMNSVEKKEEIIDDLINKGMKNPDKKIISNIDKIINKFNECSKDCGFDKTLELTKVMNKILRKKD